MVIEPVKQPLRVDQKKKKIAKPGADGNFSSYIEGTDNLGGKDSHDLSVLTNYNIFLELQQVPYDKDKYYEEKKTQAGQILDHLTDLRLALLNGVILNEKIIQLHQLYQIEKINIEDTKLKNILQEIELRAAVELAKLDQALVKKVK